MCGFFIQAKIGGAFIDENKI